MHIGDFAFYEKLAFDISVFFLPIIISTINHLVELSTSLFLYLPGTLKPLMLTLLICGLHFKIVLRLCFFSFWIFLDLPKILSDSFWTFYFFCICYNNLVLSCAKSDLELGKILFWTCAIDRWWLSTRSLSLSRLLSDSFENIWSH